MPDKAKFLVPGSRFLPFAKRDDASRMVYGYLTTEAEDSFGTIFSLEATREAVEEWKKWRNLRAMHEPHAAGWVPVLELDAKGLWIGARVVDDTDWRKVQEGVYKGFSVGFDPLDGRYELRDGKDVWVFTRYILVEASLVDRPSNPDAVISLWRAEARYLLAAADEPWDFDHKADLDAIRAKLGDEGTAMAMVAGCPVAKLAKPEDSKLTLNRFAVLACMAAMDGGKEMPLSAEERGAAMKQAEGLLALFARARAAAPGQPKETSMDKQQMEQAVETGIKAFFRRIFGGQEAPLPQTSQAPQARVALPKAEVESLRSLHVALKAKGQDAALAEAQRTTAAKAAGEIEGLLASVDVQEETPTQDQAGDPALREQIAAQGRAIEDLKRQLNEALATRKSSERVEGEKPPFKSRWGGAFRLS